MNHLFHSLAALSITTACSSTTTVHNDPTPTNLEEAKSLAPVLCQRLRECDATNFDKAYPSINACIDHVVADAAGRDDAQKPAPCPQSQVNECVNDYGIEACDAILAKQAPSSCERC